MKLLRLTVLSLVLCGAVYVPATLVFAKSFFPEEAGGSLVTNPQGAIVGSRLIAQNFTSGRYFHPRPSACDYNAQAACGSNLSPTNPELTTRAMEIIAKNSATARQPIPADLVTASGSGLDPNITLAAAKFQLPRIAAARNLSAETVEKLLPGSGLVNVLELNLALDATSR